MPLPLAISTTLTIDLAASQAPFTIRFRSDAYEFSAEQMDPDDDGNGAVIGGEAQDPNVGFRLMYELDDDNCNGN